MKDGEYEMLNDRVLFRKFPSREEINGVHIPFQFRDPGMDAQGTVVAVGPFRRAKPGGKKHPMTVKPGDIIVYNIRDAMKMDPSARGDKQYLRIISEGDILAITTERL